ncbi:MMPL family transporter [Bacillus massiliglaciei]|uniref:MMPL family transporter n=1 Tax=Bacillus massiliglaciei TaxID=1816693 RepID=UPI000A8AB703|nr:MMPL family transporter [Bacillus massiliglaciei]
MNKLKNWRSISLAVWVLLTVVLVMAMPDLDRLVKEKGQVTILDTAQSAAADKMLKEMDRGGQGDTYDLIAVFNSGSDAALTEKDQEQIASIVKNLKSKEKELGITKISSHLDNENLEKQLVSKDQTTILTQLSIDKDHGKLSETSKEIHEVMETGSMDTYLTGSDLIQEDFANTTQNGVKKTEVIAVIFILAVLIIVFRSPVVPIVSLLTVGVSYLVSMGILTQIVDHFDFPFSNFTQVFLVVVLFGVGTDYNILLYTRFKEELSRQEDPLLAAKATFKSAGKTVLYSGLAVFIGFISLFLARFTFYQATSGVAIGIIILLLVLLTLNPFFMVLLGKRMFFPVKNFKGHGDSRIWSFLARHSVGRPIIALLLTAVISVPFIVMYSGQLNYNDLWEVSDQYESKQGINVIEAHFPAGFSSPATFVLHSNKALDSAGTLQTLDELAEKISKVDGVSEVYSPTRPSGDKIRDFYMKEQTDEVNDGLGDANGGIDEITKGLTSEKDQMGQNDANGMANVQKLMDGTDEVEGGLSELGKAMNQLTDGIHDGASGAEEIEDGLAALKANTAVLSNSTSQLYSVYSQLEKGLSSYTDYLDQASQTIDQVSNGYSYEQIESLMNSLLETNPELADDPDVQQTLDIARSSQGQLEKLQSQLDHLREQHESAMNTFKKANQSLAKVNDGLDQMEEGTAQLEKGAANLKNGLADGAAGSDQIAAKTNDLKSGVSQINHGQEELLTGLQDLQEQMSELQSGLSESTEGLSQVGSGLKEARSYLGGLSESDSSEKFYIPEKALEGRDFQKSLDRYMSDDRKTASMTIILDVNPYSQQAMPIIQEMNEQAEAMLKGTNLEKAKIAIAGTTARNADLKKVTQSDFLRTASIMLIGILLVLMFITRSVFHSIYIVGSLVLVYFTSLGIGEWISSHLLNTDILSWNVPFFSFIMIVALGVDYSIFLMMRYNELEGTPVSRIVEASRHIGGVVLSAAIILGGTFAALIPSGVLTLIEVATVVIIALILLSLIAMPILVPALISVTDKLNKFSKKP